MALFREAVLFRTPAPGGNMPARSATATRVGSQPRPQTADTRPGCVCNWPDGRLRRHPSRGSSQARAADIQTNAGPEGRMDGFLLDQDGRQAALPRVRAGAAV